MLRKIKISLPELLSRWVNSSEHCDETITEFVEQSSFRVSEVWLSQLALVTQVVPKDSALNWCHGRLLYSLVRQISAGQDGELTLAETGSARGFSALCMAKALSDGEARGRIESFDVLGVSRHRYWNSISDYDGRTARHNMLLPWSDLLGYVDFKQADFPSDLQKLEPKRYHLAFLDAQHTYESVSAEFYYFAQQQIAGDLVVFDDVTIGKFPGVERFVRELESLGQYQVNRLGDPEVRGYAVARKI